MSQFLEGCCIGTCGAVYLPKRCTCMFGARPWRSPASRCCQHGPSGAVARWLLPLPIYLGLSAARRPALADKGLATTCGYLGQFDSGLGANAQVGWLAMGASCRGVPLGTSVGCHAMLNIFAMSAHSMYGAELGDRGCLLWPTLWLKST